MIYLALGDSITFGYESSSDENRYVNQLLQKLNKVQRTSLHVQAKPGWTASQLLRALEKTPACILQEAELITLMIGGNDLLKTLPWFLDDPAEAQGRLTRSFQPQVEEILRQAKGNPKALLMICTVYNPFPKSEVAQQAVSGLNGILRGIAREHKGILVPVDEYYGGHEQRLVKGFKSGDLQDFRFVRNPIHPNDHGHERIAEAIFAAYMKAKAKAKKQQPKKQPKNQLKAAAEEA